MERVRRHKIWVVWLLLAVFTLPFAVKAVHSYRTAGPSGHGCSGTSHSHHDYSDCPVCQFTLSSFTEATVAGSGFRVLLFDFEPVLSFQPGFCQQVHLSYGLRAPPGA
ncbi:MAG: SurA N-terminal domain-containing protein [Tannerella sp.]|nr:SurA N-terminal domain-containing protein [Tannerella sp.]